MANVKISELPAATSLAVTDVFPAVNSGVTKQATFSLLPFLPSGIGAVARTVQSKERDIVSAKDFGATGDGTTNDAAAIQTALNVAAILNTRATVHLPQGVYNLGSTTLTIPLSVTLAGDGPRSTFINYVGTGTGIDIAGVSDWGLRDLRLGLGTSATIVGIDVRTTPGNSVQYGRICDVQIAGSLVAGQIGLRAIATGPAIVSPNWFTRIHIISIDKPLIRTATEGNIWSGILVSEFGASNGAIAIDSSCHSEFLQARVEGLTGAGTNKVAYKQTANSNIDSLVVDIGAGHTALNVTGTANNLTLSRVGSTTPLGTIVAGNTLNEAQIGAGVQILGKSAAAISAPADTNEDTLATITVPANEMGTDGVLRITVDWSFTNNANSKTLRIRFSGAAGTTYTALARTTDINGRSRVEISNRGVTNSQTGWADYIPAATGTPAVNGLQTSAVDTTVATSIVISGQKANGADTLTLEKYLVELIRP